MFAYQFGPAILQYVGQLDQQDEVEQQLEAVPLPGIEAPRAIGNLERLIEQRRRIAQ